ncbi:MAG: restriction endonuclease subunit S [Novosphingobium sp.]|nr:restriction endonuclease subunit S [Novosphingobium sp.]
MTELPKGWAPARLSDICDINPRVDKSAIDHTQLVSFVPMPAVEAENGRIDVSVTRPFGEVKQGYTPFQTGDVLFAKITPCMENGKMAIVPKMPSEYGFGSTEFHVLRALCGVEPRFIYHIVSNQGFRYYAEHHMTGAVGQKRVPASLLADHPVAVPPLNEQRRIVQKIEAVFEQIDKGVESLRVAKTTLGLYRQSLLKSAFEGRLTAAWRAQNPDKLETPKALLARIQKERETRYKSALDDWQTALSEWRAGGEVGRKPGKPSRPEAQSEIPLSELELLSDLPKEWMFTKLANLGDLGRGKSKHRPRNDKRLFDGRYPFIQTGEVKAANRFVREFTATYSDFGLEQSKLWPAGTLCITIAANIAQTAFLTFEACFPDSIVGFTAFSGGVSPEYVESFIASARMNIEAYAPATAQKNINLNTLETLNIPICSPAEQAEITRILDARLTAADAMEAEINAALLRAEALRQSILKQAFSGTLVPQDPTDEPAPTLLARIKAERAKAGKTKPRKTAHAG